MVINLISSPRNVSTALMYSFAQRDEVKVIDEPFYGYYLTKTTMEHPGKTEIIENMEQDPEIVVERIVNDQEKPVLFVKNMAHHLVDFKLDWMKEVQNVFLIRDPHQLISSFVKVIDHPTIDDIAVKRQYELFEWLSNDQVPPVLDAQELILDPEMVIAELCKQLNISFDKGMLHWEAGPRPEDGIWAKYWYANVHETTGFSKTVSDQRQLPAHCVSLYEEAVPFYDKMFTHAIKG